MCCDMEGFLEANQVVELSLNKLSVKRSGDSQLRRTLLISQVLHKAQDVATSAEDTILSSSDRCSSRLLANLGHNQRDIDDLPATHIRTVKPPTRQSLIATPSPLVSMDPEQDESMDFDNVSSLLGDILQDDDMSDSSLQKVLEETRGDPSALECEVARPVSPGKRNYEQAFPFVLSNEEEITSQRSFDNLKRFKSCTQEASPLESLPGFCGYLSSYNLQSAPFITYMFGRGFAHPSNPNSASCDWPTASPDLGALDQELATLSKNTPVTPILAF